MTTSISHNLSKPNEYQIIRIDESSRGNTTVFPSPYPISLCLYLFLRVLHGCMAHVCAEGCTNASVRAVGWSVFVDAVHVVPKVKGNVFL